MSLFGTIGFLLTITICSIFIHVCECCNEGGQSGTTSCLDEKECYEENINCERTASCRGYLGCYQANLTRNYNNDCSGDYGCLQAVATGDSVKNYGIHCDGNFGCQQVVTDGVGKFYYVRGRAGAHYAYFKNGLYYYVTGNWALSNGMIDSGDQEVVTIQLKGDDCASGATVLCREDSECYIDCTTTSNCDSANITCFGDATNSNCDCTGEYCPPINFISASTDKQLKRQFENDIVNNFFEKQNIFNDEMEEKRLELLEEYNNNERIAHEKWIDWNQERFEKYINENKFESLYNHDRDQVIENYDFEFSNTQGTTSTRLGSYTLIIVAIISIVTTLIAIKLITTCKRNKDSQYTTLIK